MSHVPNHYQFMPCPRCRSDVRCHRIHNKRMLAECVNCDWIGPERTSEALACEDHNRICQIFNEPKSRPRKAQNGCAEAAT